jgi:hypothetical protein
MKAMLSLFLGSREAWHCVAEFPQAMFIGVPRQWVGHATVKHLAWF